MVPWGDSKHFSYHGVRTLDDSPIFSTSVNSATGIRTAKDQKMAKSKSKAKVTKKAAYRSAMWTETNTTNDLVPKKPWVLSRASNWVSGLRPSDKEGMNPKDALGSAKVPMHLVPVSSTVMQAYCMDDGNIKYGPYNWRMEDIQSVGYLAAAKRHIDAFMDGQEFDSVTGKPHLGYALATIGIVIDAWLNGTLIDNRPVPGVGGQLIDALSSVPGREARSPEEIKEILTRIANLGQAQTEKRREPKA